MFYFLGGWHWGGTLNCHDDRGMERKHHLPKCSKPPVPYEIGTSMIMKVHVCCRGMEALHNLPVVVMVAILR